MCWYSFLFHQWKIIVLYKIKMECKFKQISHLDEVYSVPVRSSQSAVNEAISCLIGNVGQHVYNKTAMEKSKTFLKNKIISFEVDSVKQIYQTRPTIPYLCKEQQSPRKGVADCMRPMSAQIRHYSRKHHRSTINSDSRKTIESHAASLKGFYRSKRNTTEAKSAIDSKKNSKRNNFTKTLENEKKFFAVKSTCEEDDINLDFIEQLRLKKKQQENEVKKKQQFLKSIQMDSTSYSTAQSKFIQSISRKKFIYGHQGEVIQINGTSEKLHLKKISALSKSRVEIKSKKNEELRKFQDQLKQNIYIEFKGRQLYQSRPETSKPNHTQKTQQTQDHAQNNKLFSMRQTKRQTEDQKTHKKIDETKSGQRTPIKRDIRGSTQTDKGIVKKKMEKILFYPSPNSIYRVINEATPLNTNHAVTVEEF